MNHQSEIASGKRFAFGENWSRFLAILDDERILLAERSLRDMLGIVELTGKSFLDIGSGSGLFSLAARRLGATVHSFDYDPASVECTKELRRRYFPNDPAWVVEEGSVLDTDYLRNLGHFDVVYSWGVLHHTGSMWTALENTTRQVRPDGRLFIAIYNDQGWISEYWLQVKQLFCKSPVHKFLILVLHAPYLLGARFLFRFATRRGAQERGMSLWHDMFDWLGGYPFEVAAPGRVVDFLQTRNYYLERLVSCAGRHGCNQYVFVAARHRHSPQLG